MTDNENLLSNEKSGIFARWPVWVIFLLILLLGGFLRLIKQGQSPPGLNQDEALNAWNAYCLLKTGKDQVGVSWPIFYTRGFGGNASTLYMYFLIPFQAIWGLNIFTTRLGGEVAGIITIVLVYFVGKRLFDRQVGLMAALLLSLNPWHLQQSRWGHEATLCPLLGILPLAMLLWAYMPISDNKTQAAKPLLAGLGGVVAGICCYGYHSVRIFIPVFFLTVFLLTLPEWWRCIKTRKGVLAVAAFIFGFAVTFGPLAWQHIFHPEGISRHGLEQDRQGLFLGDAPIGTAVKNISSRYIHHFGPDFLFIHGSYYAIQSPPGCGMFHWYMLPVMLLGLIFLLRTFKSSISARVLLAFIIAYPVGDSLYLSPGITTGMHALRSAPGLCSLILLGAAGAVSGARWLKNRSQKWALIAKAVFFIAVVILNIQHFRRFYFEFNRNPYVYHVFHSDLIEACEWLKPRLNEFDAVFITTDGLNMPYVITLVTLGYDPRQWFNEPREFITAEYWEYYNHYGKMYFMYDDSFVPVLTGMLQKTAASGSTPSTSSEQASSPQDRILFVVRPGEYDFCQPVPVHRILRPDGEEALWMCKARASGEQVAPPAK